MIVWVIYNLSLQRLFPNNCPCLFLDESVVLAEDHLEENDRHLVNLYDFSSVDNPHVRKNFPETWIWLDTNMG